MITLNGAAAAQMLLTVLLLLAKSGCV